MKNRIQINLGTDHTLECTETIIGRSGEGLVSRLEITVPDALSGYNVYIDFEKPNGESLRTPKLDVEYGVAYYDVPQYLLIDNGDIKVQLVFENSNGRVWKSSKKRYTILKSINAVDDIPEKEDFITVAQQLIDELNQEVEDIAEALSNKADFAQAVINACGGQTQIVTINGKVLRFFVDTQEEYEKLSEAQQQNLFAIITDDTTRDTILQDIKGQGEMIAFLGNELEKVKGQIVPTPEILEDGTLSGAGYYLINVLWEDTMFCFGIIYWDGIHYTHGTKANAFMGLQISNVGALYLANVTNGEVFSGSSEAVFYVAKVGD